eukprot:5724554-Amphidinium_carterae.1
MVTLVDDLSIPLHYVQKQRTTLSVAHMPNLQLAENMAECADEVHHRSWAWVGHFQAMHLLQGCSQFLRQLL